MTKLFSKTIAGLVLASIFLASCSSVDRIASSNRPGKVKHSSVAQAQAPSPAKEILNMVDVNTKAVMPIASAALQATAPTMTMLTQKAMKAELHQAFSNLQKATEADGKVTMKERMLLKKVKKAMLTGVKPNGDGKSQVVAIWLAFAILLMMGGMHRIYLGYIGMGILQCATGGGFLVWQIIDIIRLFSGDLKPKDGDYDVTL